jgi:hypothetical protein
MIEMIEKTLLAGIGALSLTQKKAEELIDELQKQFNLSEDKGREQRRTRAASRNWPVRKFAKPVSVSAW